jgi:hypothetical protein
MLKIIIYIIIAIMIIHFILYYFNTDYNYKNLIKDNFKFILNTSTLHLDSSLKKQDVINITESINESINELKTLNECIYNGKINSVFS